ncbi:MAG: MBL fold metallo-hydrolase [Nitrospirae bacterium]|nr:MBL fold metallo-hydrolase [Nitrospirota bacterium]
MIHETLVVGLFQCNCSILGCEETREALVIDPGDAPDRILEVLDRHKRTLRYILHTHAHFDHIGGTKRLKEVTGATVLLHPEDLYLYEKADVQASYFGLEPPETAPVDELLEDEGEIPAGSLRARVFHTPGHTPGSVCFHLNRGAGKVFTGDTLFRDSIGRTDLWGGSEEKIMASIRDRLLILDDDTAVYPGHGAATTIGRERERNPFLR